MCKFFVNLIKKKTSKLELYIISGYNGCGDKPVPLAPDNKTLGCESK